MKIFIIGLTRSGRTTIAQAISQHLQAYYIDAMSWVRSAFREQRTNEHNQKYEDEYDQFLSIKRMVNPELITNYVNELLASHGESSIFVIDGIISPKDFAALFDYQQDIVVFVNRTDEDIEYKDHEKIGVSVIRDFCLWLSSAGLLTKKKWLEYNFKIPGEESDLVKELGAKNSVFIIRSINKVISHLLNLFTQYAPNTITVNNKDE